MAEFENPMFDPDGPGLYDVYSFDLPDPPLNVQQQLDASGERIQSMRGEIRQGELQDQKKRLVDTYCYLFLLSVFILWFSYYVSDIF